MAEDVTLDDLMSLNVNYYLSLVAFTILVFEYCLTFVDEVERFWRMGRLNWASGLFYINRYMVLLGHIPVMIEYFWSTNNPYKLQYFAIVIQIVVSSMLIMRMYALYERSKKVLAVLVGVALLAVAIGCWAIIGGTKTKPMEILIPVGCGASLTHAKAVRLGGAWGGMLLFDGLVFGMTLYKSISVPRTKEISLISVLLRDGAIYFSVMMASNLANILTFIFGGAYTRGVATTLTNIISSVMISRLMLNLRHPSLVSHSEHSLAWVATATEGTYPNLTFVEPSYETEYSDGGEIVSQPQVGRARMMYDYLAKGSSTKDRDVELVERERVR